MGTGRTRASSLTFNSFSKGRDVILRPGSFFAIIWQGDCMNTLLKTICTSIEENPAALQGYHDLYAVCVDYQRKGREKAAQQGLLRLSAMIERFMPKMSGEDAVTLYELHRDTLQRAAAFDFESFILFSEWNREPEKRFYLPRRRSLRAVVKELQRLADDELDLLAISLPPGTGKTTLAIFFITWLALRNPEEPILTGSHSNPFVRGVYDECLRLLDQNGEYLCTQAFPGVGVTGTNAKDCRINLGRKKRFETLEYTTIGSGNAGLYRAVQLLYCDDLVSGLEVALSKERLDKLWGTYTVDLRQRRLGDHCKELHIATRWSVHDVIGRLERIYDENNRASFLVVPALNAAGESNFDYDYGVGFSTKDYLDLKNTMDEASWLALYMNQPIEREGLLYCADELRRFFELPAGEPDAIIGVCDTKDRGKDYAVLPVAYVYGNNYFIADVLCNNANVDVIDPLMVEILYRNHVQQCRFESNSAGGRTAQKVQADLKRRGGITNITTRYTSQNKETKIITNAGWVKEHCLFLDDSAVRPGSDYAKFMRFLTSYTQAGRNPHDDVPDSMAMLAIYAQGMAQCAVEVFKRPW